MGVRQTTWRIVSVAASILIISGACWLTYQGIAGLRDTIGGQTGGAATGFDRRVVQEAASGVITILSAIAVLGFALYRLVFAGVTGRSAPTGRKTGKLLEQEVRQRTAELRRVNEGLKTELTQHPLIEQDLRQRIKQLSCFYGLSKLLEPPQAPLGEILQETAYLLRSAYQQPDITCIRITYEGLQYKAGHFRKSELSQHAPIRVDGEEAGGIEVYCLDEMPQGRSEVFLKEERDLLDAVAERLGSIAERNKAEDKLQLFRNLIKQSNDCIFVIEPQWGRLLDTNDRACERLGYTQSEFIDMTLRDIDESVSDERQWQILRDALKRAGDVIRESRLRHKDGTTFFVEASLKFVSHEKEDYIIALARDITERREAEQKQAQLIEELRKTNEKMEGINEELKEFAYIVSHDLKAPLWGIKTLVDWICADYGEKLGEDGRERLNSLTDQVRRMQSLIDGVLQYSRAGHVKEENVRVDLNEVLGDVIEMVAPPENITVSVEDRLPVVECGTTRMTQVFQNLLSNAIKYMDKPQGRIDISYAEDGDYWRFCIADNGCGIDGKHFERIFRMFQTLAPADASESTGVGLAVVKKIVELYGGKVWVESEIGQGSRFFFTLPRQQKKAGQASLSAAAAF